MAETVIFMRKYIQGRLKTGFSAFGEKIKKYWKSANKLTIAKNIVLAGFACVLFFVIVVAGTFAWYAKDLPNPNGLANRNVSQSTKIYDRTGTHLLYEIALDENRTLVTLDNIPDSLEKATITAEDRGFYQHQGFSLRGYARSAMHFVLSFGRVREGASTITQQLVKNAILSNEKTLSRKVKELMLSVALEQVYSKDQILQMYLNEIPYGQTNYGIESASDAYFGKKAKDLTLAESATLAALPQSPTTYLNNPVKLKARKNWILNGMVDAGYVSRADADTAIATETPVTNHVGGIEAPHFVFWVKSLLEDKYSTKIVETGGLRVITTLDYDKQKMAEQAVTDGVAKNGKAYGFTTGGLLSLDPKNGEVLAMVGSADFRNNDIDGQVNVTIQPLQPGSSIKPIVYAAAFEKGYTPNTLLWDVNTVFPTATGPYPPQNYDGKEHGIVSMRKALQGSLNIPAVKTLYLVGIDTAVKFAHRLGYTTLNDPSKIGLSMVLGGAEVKLIDHAAAYGVFANGGTYHAPVGILKVEAPDGSTMEEFKPEENQGERVLDVNIASIMSNVLSDNEARSYVFTTNNWLVLPNRPVAAKTGTTNSYKDAWTMGYTPSLVAGVWVGNANGSFMNKKADGSQVAAPIWNQYMKNALQGTPVEAFPKASIPQTGKPVLDGKLPGTPVVLDTASGKLATDLTPERFRKEMLCGEYHTILKYVDKDQPTDPAPNRPENDPDYLVWEKAVQDYITRHNASLKEGEKPYETCVVPTESDDMHTLENKPGITMMQPQNDWAVGRTIDVQVSLETRRMFGRVEYSVDGVFIASSSSTGGAIISLPGWVSIGSHSFTATVYDDVDNSASATALLNVNEAGSQGAFRITNPFTNQTIEKSGSAYAVVVEVPHSGDYATLSIIARNLWDGATTTVGTISKVSAISTVNWTLPTAGDYTLGAEATRITGEVEETVPVKVFVREPVVTSITPIP
jgi:1A family penicillin-binding protein